jgi:Bardet-Biedl syndrome 7 protein
VAGGVQEKRKQLRAKSSAMVAPARVLPMQHSLRLDARAALYELSIESAAPMFCVAVVSTAKVTFLEAAASVAILTVSTPPSDSGLQSLATYRCASSRHLQAVWQLSL